MKITHHDKFDSTLDLYEHVKNTPPTDPSRHQASRADDDPSFYGTETFREAYKLGTQGWAEGLKMVSEADLMLRASGIGQTYYRPEPIGQIFDAGSYFAGNPECWLEPQTNHEYSLDGRIKRIAIGASFLAGVSGTQVKYRGAGIVYCIDLLEALGYRCQIDILSASKSLSRINGSNGLHLVTTRVKDADRDMNREKLAFAAINPAYFRRFIFGVRERKDTEFLEAWDVGYAYGSTIDITDIKDEPEVEDYDIIFPNRDFRKFRDFDSAVEQIKKQLKQAGIDIDEHDEPAF